MSDSSNAKQALKDSIGALKDLLPYLWKQAGLLTVGIIGLLLGIIFSFSLGLMIRYVIDNFPGTPAEVSSFLDRALAFGIGYFVVVGVTGYVAGYCLRKVAACIARDVRVEVFSKIIRKDFNYLERQSSGDMQTRIIADAGAVGRFLAEQLPAVASAGLGMIVGVIGALYISEKLTLIVLLCLPFIFVPVVILSKRLRRIGDDIQTSIADTGATGGEVFRNLKLVRAYGKEQFEDRRFAERAQNIVKHRMRGVRLQLGMSVMVETTAMCAFVVLLWSAGKNIYSGAISIGQLVAFAYFALMIVQSGGRFLRVATSLNVAVGTSRKVIEYLAEGKHEWPGTHQSAATNGAVSFDNVRFAYPTRPEDPALRGLSLSVGAGEHLALVGQSGAGKSTIFELLLRLHDDYEGVINLDGTDIRDFDASGLRSAIGYVPQRESLISGTVIDNIGYGVDEPTEDAVVTAAKLAHAHEFIEKLPAGYHTDLGEVAGQLSGGQKQRISLARALIRNPSILLLDEAKSSLDPESERLVAGAIEEWARKRGATVVSIAHKLSTVRNADKIAVVSDGQVIDQGSHAELMRSSPAYQKLSFADNGGDEFEAAATPAERIA